MRGVDADPKVATNGTDPLDYVLLVSPRSESLGGLQIGHSWLPHWNATSHADRHGDGCPSAPAMQRSGDADLTPASTISHENAE